MEMEESDKPKTAFATHLGLYQFAIVPFGLSNAPSVFERLRELILRGLQWEICLCYLDDVIVFWSTFEIAMHNLKLVFSRFREANLKLKPSKCVLFQDKVLYLGHVVSGKGIECDSSKINSVKR